MKAIKSELIEKRQLKLSSPGYAFLPPIAVLLLIIFGSASSAWAHQPVIEEKQADVRAGRTINIAKATGLKDPTKTSLAVYGSLDSPSEIDLYTFKTRRDASIPVEVLVPVKPTNRYFKPSFVLFEKSKKAPQTAFKIDSFQLPTGYSGIVANVPAGKRQVFFEPFSAERLYKGSEKLIKVKASRRYYLAVFEPRHYMGDYALAVGAVEDFSNTSFLDLIGKVVKLKLGVVGGRQIPWLDIVGLFLFLAGFVVGLGAVTVIDLHGFLGRTSGYWTEATTRTHKVTKPLIWLGVALATTGGIIFYRQGGLSGTAAFHLVLVIILVLNGMFLSFVVSPYLLRREREGKERELLPLKMQRRIALSFIISIIGWWGSLFLLVWYLLMLR